MLSRELLERFLEKVTLLLAEADSCTVEGPLFRQQVLDGAGWSRFRGRLLLIITRGWFHKQRLSLFDIFIQILRLSSVVTIEATNGKEFSQIMTLANQVGDFFKLLQCAIWVTVNENSENFLHVIGDSMFIIKVSS